MARKRPTRTRSFLLRCVYTEYDTNFHTQSDVRYETVIGYDVKLLYLTQHSIVRCFAKQPIESKIVWRMVADISVKRLRQKLDKISYDKSD